MEYDNFLAYGDRVRGKPSRGVVARLYAGATGRIESYHPVKVDSRSGVMVRWDGYALAVSVRADALERIVER